MSAKLAKPKSAKLFPIDFRLAEQTMAAKATRAQAKPLPKISFRAAEGAMAVPAPAPPTGNVELDTLRDTN